MLHPDYSGSNISFARRNAGASGYTNPNLMQLGEEHMGLNTNVDSITTAVHKRGVKHSSTTLAALSTANSLNPLEELVTERVCIRHCEVQELDGHSVLLEADQRSHG